IIALLITSTAANALACDLACAPSSQLSAPPALTHAAAQHVHHARPQCAHCPTQNSKIAKCTLHRDLPQLGNPSSASTLCDLTANTEPGSTPTSPTAAPRTLTETPTLSLVANPPAPLRV